MTNHTLTRWLHPLSITALALMCHTAMADFTTGFETTSGSYVAGSPAAGVHDTALAGTASWSALFGATSAITITNTAADVQSGTQALHFSDTDTSVAYGTSYNLTGAVDYSSTFKLHFGLNVSSYGGTGTPVQFYLGDNSTNSATKEYWTSGYVSNTGIIYLNVASSVGGTSIYGLNLGSYTTYSPLGSYISFDLTIDPTTHKYTSVIITGINTGAVDKTSTITGYTSGGEIPWLNGGGTNTAPLDYFVLAAGGASTSTFDVDNLSITNVPEPASLSLFLLGGGLMLAARRRKVATVR